MTVRRRVEVDSVGCEDAESIGVDILYPNPPGPGRGTRTNNLTRTNNQWIQSYEMTTGITMTKEE